MNTYKVRIESGVIVDVITVVANNTFNASYKAMKEFFKGVSESAAENAEITGVWEE